MNDMNSLKVEKSDRTENIDDIKILLICILSGAIGFSLIDILPYEIPLFLRGVAAFLFLGIPLLDPKKTVLFGIAGGVGFFIKDLILWDLFSFKWTSPYDSNIPLLTGLMIGTFLGVTLWSRKAIVIFPLTGVLALSGYVGFIFSFFLILIGGDFFQNGNLQAGIVFGAGMCLYLLMVEKTPSQLRKIMLIAGILLLALVGFLMIIFPILTMGHPPHVGNTVASIGEVVQKESSMGGFAGKQGITVTNYTFLQDNDGRVLKAGIMVQNPVDVSRLRLHLWIRQDEYLGREITEIPVGHVEAAGQDTTNYHLSFDNLPEHLRTKDFAVVWEVWTSRGIEYVIWRTK